MRLRTGQQGLDFGALGRVAAEQPIAPKLPEIAEARDRIDGHRRHVIRVRRTNGSRIEDALQFCVVKAEQSEIEILQFQVREFDPQQFLVPAGI